MRLLRGPIVKTDTRALEEPPTPPRSVPLTADENILQQDDGVLERLPAEQGPLPLTRGHGDVPQNPSRYQRRNSLS